MSKVEESLTRIWGNVAKLDLQIASFIKGLLNDSLLEESPLVPILDPSKIPKTEEPKCRSINAKSTSTTTATKKPGFALSSKRKATSISPINIQEETLSKKINLQPRSEKVEATKAAEIAKKKPIFTTVDSERFFVPVMDKWAFGITLINSSKIAQKLPDVILSIVNRHGNALGQPFSYNYKSMTVNVDKEFNFLNTPNTLPVEEALPSELDEDQRVAGNRMVKPSSKFAVSVFFSHPMPSTLSNEDGMSVLVSFLSDGKTVWTESIPFNSMSLDFSYDGPIFTKFSDKIFIAMSQHYQHFKLKLLPNGASDLFSRVDDFLTDSLKLKNVQTVKTRFDTQTRTYSTQNLTFFWGIVLELEFCDRNENVIRGSAFARSPNQYYNFHQLLLQWIEDQKRENYIIRVSHELSKNEDVIPELFRKEIKTLIHFIYLHERRMIDEGIRGVPASAEETRYNHGASLELIVPSKTRVAIKWLRTYATDMILTDSMFMGDNDS